MNFIDIFKKPFLEGMLVKELMKVENVISASLVAHDGEVTF